MCFHFYRQEGRWHTAGKKMKVAWVLQIKVETFVLRSKIQLHLRFLLIHKCLVTVTLRLRMSSNVHPQWSDRAELWSWPLFTEDIGCRDSRSNELKNPVTELEGKGSWKYFCFITLYYHCHKNQPNWCLNSINTDSCTCKYMWMWRV